MIKCEPDKTPIKRVYLNSHRCYNKCHRRNRIRQTM